MNNRRWIVVSNRLPFTYHDDRKELVKSSGGLVTAIKGIKTGADILWVGSVPESMPGDVLEEIRSRRDGNISYYPVSIPDELYGPYYNGVCNDLFWPLFHYENDNSRYVSSEWFAYKEVNKLFVKPILEVGNKNDFVWIHDFHLFLVSGYLKARHSDLKTGFFLHIPFPSAEIFKQIPVREEVLQSLLSADLVAFHDSDYLRHFCSAVYRVLGIGNSLLSISQKHHTTHLGVFPVSIDTHHFIYESKSQATREAIERFSLPQKQGGLILGVDRLDYTKGIDLKLKAFRELLRRLPADSPKPQLLQVAVPSRLDVPEYKRLKDNIDKLVGEINGEFSTPSYTPIRYIFNSVAFHELLALYRAADVLLVTSKRDGMNLVCLEYIASQDLENPGVVVLSEFTGAASALSHVITINPWDVEKTAERLQEALSMPLDERKAGHGAMYDFLANYTADQWAESFIKTLADQPDPEAASKRRTRPLQGELRSDLLDDLARAASIVLLIDYDGTLVPIEERPELAVLTDEIRGLLDGLSACANLEVVIVSGRPLEFVEREFDGIAVSLASEHGGRFYDRATGEWQVLVRQGCEAWYEEAYATLRDYRIRTLGSFIEKKEFGLAWHYRKSPKEFGAFQARKLLRDLEIGLSNHPVEIIEGKKVVEIKAREANKGVFVDWLKLRSLGDEPVRLVAIGDDRTDEDMFRAVNSHGGVTIKVGEGTSAANYRIEDHRTLLMFLKALSDHLPAELGVEPV